MAQSQGTERAVERTLPSEKVETVSVERLSHPDIPGICALYRRVWDAERPPLPAALEKTFVPNPLEFTSWMESITYFAARKDGKIVGAIGCEGIEDATHLVQLAVDPEVRRQGIGSALVAAAVEWAKHEKSPSIWADPPERFGSTCDLFRHVGFTEVGLLRRHRFGEDVRVFERVL